MGRTGPYSSMGAVSLLYTERMPGSRNSGEMPPWPGRARPQLADEVVQHVRGLIMAGEVEQGSFIRLDKLAKDMGISATPVREAMAALERDGFVRLEPRRGYIVSRFSRRDIADL